MINYILADLKRITLRIPRAVAMVVILGILIAYMRTAATGSQWNVITYTLTLEQYFGMLTVMLGVVELISVFSEDFKAKTMQVAIGIGIPRWRIVLSKFIELMVLVFVDLVVIALVALIAAPILQVAPNGEQVMEILGNLFSVWLGIIAYGTLCTILIFFTQGIGIATILYLALASGIVNSILEILFSLDAVKSFHLQRFTLTAIIKMFNARILLGTFSFPNFLGILLYTALAFTATLAIFSKRELDF